MSARDSKYYDFTQDLASLTSMWRLFHYAAFAIFSTNLFKIYVDLNSTRQGLKSPVNLTLYYFDIGAGFINYVMVCPVVNSELFVYNIFPKHIVFDVCSEPSDPFIFILRIMMFSRIDNGLMEVYRMNCLFV